MPAVTFRDMDIPPPWRTISRKFPWLYKLVFPDPIPDDSKQGFKHKYAIDLMKCLTLPVCIALSKRYACNSTTMAVYTALHGTYGLMWLTKSFVFGDKKWDRRVPWVGRSNT